MANQQRRHTREQKAAYVTQWQSSGLSQARFARRANINPKTFNSWTRSLAARTMLNTNMDLLPVDNAQTTSAHYLEQKSLKISLPTGIKLWVPFNDGELLTLIRGLMSCI